LLSPKEVVTMIVYHGGPYSDAIVAMEVWRNHHAMISFARPEQIEIAAEHSSSFALDNGAFSLWRSGQCQPDWDSYYRWVEAWKNHAGCDFAIIPDVIEGTETHNDDLPVDWPFMDFGVPVYHLHESLERLERLMTSYCRIALGSSGSYRSTGTLLWWDRMALVMELLCDDDGRPKTKVHGLRMLAPEVVARIPLPSADSAMVARNVNRDQKWKGTFQPRTKAARAITLRDRVEAVPVASRWSRFDDAMNANRSPETGSAQFPLFEAIQEGS
jgi:hypothetical protein